MQRFLVIPTGKMIFSWGVWDTQSKPLPSGVPEASDFVSRFKIIGHAISKASQLNKLYAAAEARKAVA